MTQPPDEQGSLIDLPVTDVLRRWQAGTASTDNAVFALVHSELRKIARSAVARSGGHNTSTPTDLVHDLWLRLPRTEGYRWPSRGHFYAAAATAMRRLLIDARRRRSARKRSPDGLRIELEQIDALYESRHIDVMAVEEALSALAANAPASARVAELRIFLWLTHEEVGQLMGLTRRQVDRLWSVARPALERALADHEEA
ncbi:MAG: sigma-70 family RNA polymerase sigma factor [Planctomycetes bacterium]|nr:sigma-70 family RNA polymerase sigma factor [Planctomycetota bacterium]